MFYLEKKLKKSIFYPEKTKGIYVLSRKKPEGINVILSRKN